MKFNLQLPVQAQSTMFVEPWEATAGRDAIIAVARAADESGFHAIAACEHVAVPPHRAEAMGRTWADPVAVLSLCAGVTERVQLMTYVYVLALRHPLMAAKALSTLDWLSNGRLIVGVGAGHVEEEFTALGVDFATRGTRLSQSIEALRECFTSDLPALDAPFTSAPMFVYPKAVRTPPILVAGSTPAAVKRAAKYGDGWLAQGPATPDLLSTLAQARAEANRADEPFEVGHIAGFVHVGEPTWDVGAHVLSGSPQHIADTLTQRMPDGATMCQVMFRSRSASELADQVRLFGTAVAPCVA